MNRTDARNTQTILVRATRPDWLRGRARSIPAVLALAILFIAGCGKAEEPLIPTFPVAGQVLYADGSPLPSGIIQFVSKREPALNMSAIIGSDGSFELQTIQGNTSEAGAIEGECEVMVTLPIVADRPPETVVLPKAYHIGQSENRFVIRLDRAAR